MKIKAPFEVREIASANPTQAAGNAWYLFGRGLRRYQTLEALRTGHVTLWGYCKQSYLGSMLLSLPSHTYTWRRP